MKSLPDGCIDLTITSPPYGSLRDYNGFSFDFPSVASELFRITKTGGVVVWVVADQTINGSETGESFRQALGFLEIGFRLHDTMIYERNGMTFPQGCVRYWQCAEFMFVLSKGKPKTINIIRDRANKSTLVGKNVGRAHQKTGRERNGTQSHPTPAAYGKTFQMFGMRTNIWTYSTGNAKTAPDSLWKRHSAVFPLQLAKDHITTWSNPGDLVFDPMCGSGQTLIASEQLGRQFLGMDCSSEYCDLARERLEWYRSHAKTN